jgi:3-oxoacyl-[acyl-carrier protein] reductase
MVASTGARRRHGAARGIGFGIATRFAEEGASVAVLDLDAEPFTSRGGRELARTRARQLASACDDSDDAAR